MGPLRPSVSERLWVAAGHRIQRRVVCRVVLTPRSGRGRQCFTPPAASPDCQYRGRNRNATTSGMMDTSEPVITIENRAWEPEPAAEVACHCARPTVSGKYSGLLSMI